MRRSYAVPASLALLLALPIINPTSATADPQVPTLPGPSVQGPTLPGQSVQSPTLAAPSLQSPTLGGPSVQGPTLSGYQQSTSYVIQRALAQRGVPFL